MHDARKALTALPKLLLSEWRICDDGTGTVIQEGLGHSQIIRITQRLHPVGKITDENKGQPALRPK